MKYVDELGVGSGRPSAYRTAPVLAERRRTPARRDPEREHGLRERTRHRRHRDAAQVHCGEADAEHVTIVTGPSVLHQTFGHTGMLL